MESKHSSLEARCWQAAIIAVFALMLLFGRTIPAHAWTWEENEYTLTGSGDKFCGSTRYPCVLWYQPNNTSIDVYAWFQGLSLSFQDYDFTGPTLNAMAMWNGQDAWNPYLYQCTEAPCGSITIEGGTRPCHSYGATGLSYGTEHFINGNYTAYLTSVTTVLNNISLLVLFNNEMSETEGECYVTPDAMDGRQTIAHELGHVLGIGGSDLASALMFDSVVGGCQCYVAKTDDINAIQGIYPGYIP